MIINQPLPLPDLPPLRGARQLPPDPGIRPVARRRVSHLTKNYALRARRITTSGRWAIEQRPSHTRPGVWLPAVTKAGKPLPLRFGTLRRRRQQWARQHNPNPTAQSGRWAWLRAWPTPGAPAASNGLPEVPAAS